MALFVFAGLPAWGQFDGNIAARAIYKQGEKALSNGSYADAVADYQKAISLDPNFAEAYQQYIFARYLELPLHKDQSKTAANPEEEEKAEADKLTQSLVEHFQSLSQQHPDKAIYLWALGQMYSESNPSREELYCRQAIQIDPNFAPGYSCLADIANLRGDDAQKIVLLRKVMNLESDSSEADLAYVVADQSDAKTFKNSTMQMIQRFPDSPNAAKALYWYAIHQSTEANEIEVLEQIHKQFPPGKFAVSSVAAEKLFILLDRTDPPKAQALAHEMYVANPKGEDWTAYSLYADTMAKASREVKEKNLTAALVTLRDMKAPNVYFDMTRKELLSALALDESGKTSAAFSALSMDYAKHPTDEVRAALVRYGARLGKNSEQIEASIWSVIRASSTPAIPFSLQDFSNGKQVSLADFRGHVVVVDFWFPNCGPCRESFPHLQKIAQKYKGQGLVVIAINGMEAQDSFVLPMLRSKGYDFIPLKGRQQWALDVYHVQAFPSTFLIGEDGRVYFRPHLYDDSDEHAVGLEIDELLSHSGN
ncbi:MAG: redoxin family protein [Acidobacteriaceae bacterium]